MELEKKCAEFCLLVEIEDISSLTIHMCENNKTRGGEDVAKVMNSVMNVNIWDNAVTQVSNPTITH